MPVAGLLPSVGVVHLLAHTERGGPAQELRRLIEDRLMLREKLERWELEKERVWDIPRNLAATKV